MGAIILGLPEAHEKLTAKVFWKLAGQRGYIDAGNVLEYVNATTRSLVTRARTNRGVRIINNEQADLDHQCFTFLLDERVSEQEQLLSLARQETNEQQNFKESATATLEDVIQGRNFDIGMYHIQNVTVRSSLGGQMEEGVDYDLDRPNGILKVIRGGNILDGDDLLVTCDRPGIELERHTTQVQPLFYCDVIILEFNQFDKMWLRKHSFRGYLNVVEFPAQTGEFGKYRVKVTPAESYTPLKRPEFQTIQNIEEEFSSSATSQSSQTSWSSNSSKSSSSSSKSVSSSSSSTVASVSSSSSSSNNSSSSTAASFTSSSSSTSLSSASSNSSSSLSTPTSQSSNNPTINSTSSTTTEYITSAPDP